MSLMHTEWQPMSSRRFPRSTHVSMVWTGLMVYEMAPWACPSVFSTARTAASTFRMSFSASKMRKTSMPFSAAFATNASTTSSA